MRDCSLFLLGSFLGLLLSLAQVLSVDTELSELSEDLGTSQFLGDLLRSLSELSLGLLDHVLAEVLVLSSGRLQLLSSRVSNVTLLWLVFSSGEEDQLAFVAFKSLHIQVKSLSGSVKSSVVNSNADGSSEVLADLGLCEFLK